MKYDYAREKQDATFFYRDYEIKPKKEDVMPDRESSGKRKETQEELKFEGDKANKEDSK